MVDEADLESVQELLKSAKAIRDSNYTDGEKCLLMRLLVARTRGQFADISIESLAIASRQHEATLLKRQEEQKAQQREWELANPIWDNPVSEFIIPVLPPIETDGN